jgi:pimeloyl-ACP methyl ester carboxylesterase
MNSIGKVVVGLALSLALPAGLFVHADEKQQGKLATKSIDGFWQGTLKVAVTELRLAFKISKKPDGTLTATMDSLDQGAKDIPIQEVRFKDNTLHLELKKINASFEGKMNQDGSEIAGLWKQSGLDLPLTLKPVAKPVELNRPQEPKKPYPYAEEEVAYQNKKAGIKLAGTMTLPRSKGPFPAVLLITGSGPQDRDETLMGHKPFKVLADYLTRRGIAVLRVDDRGVGQSTGDHAKATTMDFADDVEAGVAFLKSRPDIDPRQIGLIGHSEGGVIAPIVAGRSKDVAFIVMLAGTGITGEQILYLQGQAILKAMGVSAPQLLARQRIFQQILFTTMKAEPDNATAQKKIREVLAKETAKLTEAEKKAAAKQQAALDAQIKTVLTPWFRFFITYDPTSALQNVKCPVLALNGEKDVQVDPKENLTAIAKALIAGGNQDYTSVELPNLNHLFQTCQTGAITEYGKIEETIAPAALQVIGDWIVKHTRQQSPSAVKSGS